MRAPSPRGSLYVDAVPAITHVARLDAEYVLPLRWLDDGELDGLIGYLERLCAEIDVTVIDGSPAALFANHAWKLPKRVRHLAPDPWPGRNGKVGGVMTGIHRSRHERIVIADDDIRYSPSMLERTVGLLDEAQLVRPQNYFLRLPWHARWDTARSLVNRAMGADYPGTLAVRREAVLDAGGYDGDVLFENLELIRTLVAGGGREVRANSVFVGRTPPSLAHFLSQRVRQAYDDFAQPGRLMFELAMLPAMVLLARRPPLLAAAAVSMCAMAEVGRRRDGGRAAFPATSALWAPTWVLERAFCVWAALGQRMLGGVRYAGQRMPRAGTSLAALRRRREAS